MLLVFSSLLYRYFADIIGHDQISYLMEAQRLVEGDVLYGPHVAETNPPMIIWFSAVPVLLSKPLHGSPVLFLRLLVVLMILASTAWCVRILRRSAVLGGVVEVGLLGCATLGVEFGIGPYEFGQREHLFVILVLPYIVAVSAGVVPTLHTAERCALGAAAGIAIWFKPQDLLVLLALELFLAFRRRNLRRIVAPEVVSLALTAACILALVRLFTPLYFSGTLPLLLDAYWGLGTAGALQLALGLRAYTIAVLALLAGCFLTPNRRDRSAPIALIVSSVAASVAYDIQHTDWKYHAYPQWALLLLAFAFVLIDCVGPSLARAAGADPLRRATTGAAVATALLLGATAIHPHIVFPGPRPAWDPELDRYLSQNQPSTTISILSPSVVPMASAYRHELSWGSRFAHLWMMPALVQNELGPKSSSAPFKRLPYARLTALEELQREETAEDLNYWRPSVVLVQRCTVEQPCQGFGARNFDMLAWFLRSPAFDQAWSPYRKETGLARFDVYRREQ